MNITLHGNFFPTVSTSFHIRGSDDIMKDISIYTNYGYTADLTLTDVECPITDDYYIRVNNQELNTYMDFINPIHIVRNTDVYYSPRYFSDASPTSYMSVYTLATEPPSVILTHRDGNIVYPVHTIAFPSQHIYEIYPSTMLAGPYTVSINAVDQEKVFYIIEDGRQIPVIIFNPYAGVYETETFTMYFNGFHLDMISALWFKRQSDGVLYIPEIIYVYKGMIKLRCTNLPPGLYDMYTNFEDLEIHQNSIVSRNFIYVEAV